MIQKPHCLVYFLDDVFQTNLRANAQHLAPRHEKALEIYAGRFQAILKDLGSAAKCPHHNTNNENFTWWIDETLKELQSGSYQGIFDSLKAAYLASITGRFGESYRIINDLAAETEINKIKINRLDKALFFRGRKGRLNREELYHIPFSKRHCISNQRYSLTGQPLLYLGLSIVDVACELGADPESIDDFSFNYYWLKDTRNVRILDFGNSLYDLLWNHILPIAQAGTQLKGLKAGDSISPPGHHQEQDKFKLFIIAAACSFKRRVMTTQDYFSPEYVLPQAFAHWAREHKFNGILYTSTRINRENWRIAGQLKLSRFAENLAFFTNYDSAAVNDHDENLLSKFEISPSIQAPEAIDVSAEAIIDYKKRIVTAPGHSTLADVTQKAAIDLDIAFSDLVFKDKTGKETSYAHTSCGRVQRYLQFLFMMGRLVELDPHAKNM